MNEAPSTVELISQITELNDLSDYMQDEQLDRAMHLVVKILFEKGTLPAHKAPAVIAELQALATIFALKATYYATIGKKGTEESKKKNIYYTAKEAIGKLCDAMKYLSK